VDLEARISFGTDHDPVSARLMNISERGLFVAVATPGEVGATVWIELLTSDGSVLGRVEGHVAWRIVAVPGTFMPSGVGIEITRVQKDWIRFCAVKRV
jgi:hypothetical protein